MSHVKADHPSLPQSAPPVYVLVIFGRHADYMSTYLSRRDDSRDAWLEFASHEVDANNELAAVVASLESMRLDPSLPEVSGTALVNLHGALLLFQLGGHLDKVPSAALFSFGQRFMERRVLAAARRLATNTDPYVNWLSASREIEELIGRIDPELADSAYFVA
jgi:hypothetical protein